MRSVVRFCIILLLCLVIGSIGAQTNISHLRDCMNYVGTMKNVAMIGEIAYLSGNDANIHILDYTTPANPVYIGAFQLTMGG